MKKEKNGKTEKERISNSTLKISKLMNVKS